MCPNKDLHKNIIAVLLKKDTNWNQATYPPIEGRKKPKTKDGILY